MNETLVFLFNSMGLWVRGQDKKTMIGKGIFESVLVEHGFSKSELKRLVALSVLKRIYTQEKGGPRRTTYVLPLPEGYEFHDKKTTQEFESPKPDSQIFPGPLTRQ